MVDNLSPQDRQKTMRAVKSKRTGIERRLFSMLAGNRIRGWRQHASDLPGKPDIVFDARRLVIFVDGCFWHRCPHCKRKMPQTNRTYWLRKVGRNVERAERQTRQLIEDGWTVLRFWEHEIQDPEQRQSILDRIGEALDRGRLIDIGNPSLNE